MGAGGNMRMAPDIRVCGDEIYALAAALYPICRSITGNGVRETLRLLGRHVDLTVVEVPSGTAVFDWTVPKEWNLRAAHITSSRGERVVDVARSNLHVVNYSTPVRAKMSLGELRPHLHALPAQPDLIPYRTTYYEPSWGFCLAHAQLMDLPEDTYDVVIDASLEVGSLTYGEYFKRGETDEEILLSSHICHPSLANDNCSGLAVLALLAAELSRRRTQYSYRFLFAPGTIGAIAWLAHNQQGAAKRIKHGLIVSNVGDGGGPTYKKSRRGNALVDRAAAHVLAHSGLEQQRILDYSPYGYDERQYCSPGFDLAVGSLQRSCWGTFPQYHTSADNLDFIRPEHLARSLGLVSEILDVLEGDVRYRNLSPFCEPQLGKRGLYDTTSGKQSQAYRIGLLWVLNLSDGAHSLLDIAERSGLPFSAISEAAERLRVAGLLEAVSPG